MLSVVCANKTLYQFKLGLYPSVANLVYETNDVALKIWVTNSPEHYNT